MRKVCAFVSHRFMFIFFALITARRFSQHRDCWKKCRHSLMTMFKRSRLSKIVSLRKQISFVKASESLCERNEWRLWDLRQVPLLGSCYETILSVVMVTGMDKKG